MNKGVNGSTEQEQAIFDEDELRMLHGDAAVQRRLELNLLGRIAVALEAIAEGDGGEEPETP